LWLASAGVGLGLQGFTQNNFYILLVSSLIPFLFLYMDARVGRWTSGHKARLKQMELFLSDPDYRLPGEKKKISFSEFASSVAKSSKFPVLAFGRETTCGKDPQYIID